MIHTFLDFCTTLEVPFAALEKARDVTASQGETHDCAAHKNLT